MGCGGSKSGETAGTSTTQKPEGTQEQQTQETGTENHSTEAPAAADGGGAGEEQGEAN